jgi:hypothetical protein
VRKGIYICLSTLIALIASYEVAALMQPSRHRVLLSEKRGRIVDSVTGAGIANVNVVATWRTIIRVWSTNHVCDYQTVVSTDSNGEYSLPDVSRYVDVSRFMLQRVIGIRVYFNWTLGAYKAGYARVPDGLASFAGAAAVNGPGVFPTWSERPVSNLIGSTVLLESIPLRGAKAVPTESILSYDATLRSMDFEGCTHDEPSRVREISAAIREEVRNLVCVMPASEVLREDVRDAAKILLGVSLSPFSLPGTPPPLARETAGDFCGILKRDRPS